MIVTTTDITNTNTVVIATAAIPGRLRFRRVMKMHIAQHKAALLVLTGETWQVADGEWWLMMSEDGQC